MARLLAAMVLMLTLAPPAWAGVLVAPPPNPEAAISQARDDLRAVTTGAESRSLSDAEIETRLAAIPPIQARLAAVLSTLAPRLQDLEARQAQLGVPGRPGAKAEDALSVQARDDLARTVGRLNGDVQAARALSITADQAGAALSDRLRENFAARLWSQGRSILDPGLWRDFALALPGDAARLAQDVADQSARVGPDKLAPGEIMLAVAALIAALLLVGPGRVILRRLGYRRATRLGAAGRLRRVTLALWLILAGAVAPLLGGLLLRAALTQIDVLTAEVDRLIVLLIRAGVFGAVIEGIGRAVLSPGRPEWRLAPIPTAMVRRLRPFPGLLGGTAALSAIVSGLNAILGSSLATRVATDGAAVMLELAVVGAALVALGRARVAAGPAEAAAGDDESRLPWILAVLGAWLALACALTALLAGYLALAGFIVRETVWIAAVLALLFLLLRLADDLFPSLLAPAGPLGGVLAVALGLSERSLDLVGVLLAGLARLLLILLAWAALLAPFGASVEDIVRRFTPTDFVVRLGLVSISPGAVFGAIALFVVGLVITRAVRRWLEVRYLPKTDMDLGLRASLAAGVTYLGAAVALMGAFAYLGLSPAQIALFASALSVGIGFGLQSIIGNFVSGLILLAERPVRVGDWVALQSAQGDLEGDIRKINIRATEIELMDQSRLIVPNSELVSKAVRNVTHSGALGRIKIVVKLDPSADPTQARDLILARLRAHVQVLADPAPAVYLTDLKDAALEMTAFAFVPSPRLSYRIKSELLFQIVPDLKAAGIGMAAPGTVVHLDMGDRAGLTIPGEPQ